MKRAFFSKGEKYTILALLTPFLCLAGAVLIPIGRDHWTCRSVQEENSPGIGDDHVSVYEEREYLIKGGKLYLPVQCTNRSLLVMLVHTEKWDAGRMEKFLTKHPELHAYFRDPSSPHGGVLWIPGARRPWPWRFQSAKSDAANPASPH